MHDQTTDQGVDKKATARMAGISTSRPRSLLSNTTWNVLFTLWSTGVSFLFTPFLIAHIGDAHYGLYVLLMSIGGLLGVMNLGLGEATLRYVAHYYGRGDLDGIDRVVGATLSVYVVTALLGVGTLLLGAPWIASLLAIPASEVGMVAGLLRLTALNFGLALLSQAIGSIPQALQRFDINSKVLILQNCLQVGGSVIAILLGFDLYGLVLWIVISSVFSLIINVIVATRLIPHLRLRPVPTRAGLKEISSYGIFSLITNVLGIVWAQADRILLGVLVSSSTVAYLTVPWNLSFRILGFVSQAGTVLFARFSVMEEIESLKQLYLLATWVMLCFTVVVFVPITVLLPDFLALWIDPGFASRSAYVGQIVSASCIVRGAFIPYEALFKGLGRPQYLTRLVVFTSLTSLGVNLLLIPKYGLLGAGYSYCITPLWGFATVYYAWRRVLSADTPKPLLRTVGLPILIGAASLGIGYAIRSSLGPTVGWIGIGGLGLLMIVLIFVLLMGTEFLIAGRSSYVYLLLRYIYPIVRKASAP